MTEIEKVRSQGQEAINAYAKAQALMYGQKNLSEKQRTFFNIANPESWVKQQVKQIEASNNVRQMIKDVETVRESNVPILQGGAKPESVHLLAESIKATGSNPYMPLSTNDDTKEIIDYWFDRMSELDNKDKSQVQVNYGDVIQGLEKYGGTVDNVNFGITEDGILYIKDISLVQSDTDEQLASYFSYNTARQFAYNRATGFVREPKGRKATIFDYMYGAGAMELTEYSQPSEYRTSLWYDYGSNYGYNMEYINSIPNRYKEMIEWLS